MTGRRHPRSASLQTTIRLPVPNVAYHRTQRGHWKSIAKSGLIPGGGDSVNSGRAHIYMSEVRYGEEGYRSGLRGQCPIEIKIALSQAVKSGIIIAKTKMEGLITSEGVPSAYIVSIYDTEKKQMLWNRADSNIEPSVYDQSAPAASTSSPKAASVTLVARDDRDLGDEADASSGRPDASATADGSAISTTRKRDQAEVSRSAADEQAEQPPSRVRRAFISANTEPYTLVIAQGAWWNLCPADHVHHLRV